MRILNVREFVVDGHVSLPPGHVYIGRRNQTYHLPQSPFANPFPIVAGRDDSTRERVIERYERWIRSKPELVARAKRELAGAEAVVCWCAPKLACHGDVLKRIVEEDV